MKLINTELQRAAIAPFTTIEQLNANTRAIRATHSEFLITSEKAVLDVLHRFATSHFGVCYLSKSSIAEKVGVSRRQVIRICNKLEALGIIVQYATDRKRGGGQTSNTIVFLTQISARNAFVDCEITTVDTGDVTPDVTGLDALKDAPQEIKDINITRDTEKADSASNEVSKDVLIKDGLVAKLPSTLRMALAPFFDADELYAMAGVVFKAKHAVNAEIRIEDYERDYYKAITGVMHAFKRGTARNVGGLLFAAIRSTTHTIDRKLAYGLI